MSRHGSLSIELILFLFLKLISSFKILNLRMNIINFRALAQGITINSAGRRKSVHGDLAAAIPAADTC